MVKKYNQDILSSFNNLFTNFKNKVFCLQKFNT